MNADQKEKTDKLFVTAAYFRLAGSEGAEDYRNVVGEVQRDVQAYLIVD